MTEPNQHHPDPDSTTSNFEELYDINRAVAQKYHQHLKTILTEADHPVTRYVRDRGITEGSIETWQLGYAPDLWNFITEPLIKQNAIDVAVTAGVCSQKNGRLYDFFRSRLMIPLQDPKGRIVSFTGRIIGEGQPKYLNTAETPVFRKSELLFGLHRARPAILRSKHLVLTEGNFDVITLQAFGVSEAVGKGGTALTEAQLKLLADLAEVVTLIYDVDANGAGQIALKADCDRLLEAGIRVRIFHLPTPPEGGKEDADSWARRFMGEKTARFDLSRHIQKEAEEGLIWLAKSWQSSDDIDQQVTGDKRTMNLLAKVRDDGWAEKYARRLSSILDREFREITKRVNKLKKDAQKAAVDDPDEHDGPIGAVWYRRRDGSMMIREKGGFNTVADNFQLFIKYITEDEDENLTWVLEIRPVDGDPIYLEVPHEDFCSASKLKKIITGKQYSLKISDSGLSELQSYLFSNTKFSKAIKITRFGYHPPSGVFFFTNVAVNGQRLQPDEFGMVQTSRNGQPIVLSMPQTNKLKAHRFTLTDTQMEVNKFFHLYAKAHGHENALIPFCWYLMALYRDLALRHKNFSPILFLKGGPGTGKSSMVRVLTATFGKKQDGVNLKSKNTEAALVKLMSQASNSIIWFDEYHNDLGGTAGLLQAAYDNDGYHRSRDNTSTETDAIEIHSALALTSNFLPENEVFFSRCVFVSIATSHKTDEQREAFSQLEEYQEAGLGCITVQLLAHRALIEKEYGPSYEQLHQRLKQEFKGETINERFLNNMAQTMAVGFILASAGHIALTQYTDPEDILEELVRIGVANIRRQQRIMSEKTALTEFFEILQTLYDTYQIHEEIHFEINKVREGYEIRLWLPQLYNLYAAQHKRMFSRPVPERDTLQNELATFAGEPDWESMKKQIRFVNDGESNHQGRTIPRHGCCILDYDRLRDTFGLNLEGRKTR